MVWISDGVLQMCSRKGEKLVVQGATREGRTVHVTANRGTFLWLHVHYYLHSVFALILIWTNLSDSSTRSRK